MAKRKNNGPDSLTNYIKGKGGKVRRFQGGGVIGKAAAFMHKNKDAINKRYAELQEKSDMVDHAMAMYSDKYGIIGYPSDLTAQEVYLGGKEGPVTLEQEAIHDTMSRKQRDAISGENYDYAPHKNIHTGKIEPSSGYQGSKFDPRFSNRAFDARINRTRFLREAQGKGLAGASEANKELEEIKEGKRDFWGNKKQKGGLIKGNNNGSDSLTNYIKGRNK